MTTRAQAAQRRVCRSAQAQAHSDAAHDHWLTVQTAAALRLKRGMCARAVADQLGVSIRRVTELARVMRAAGVVK